MKIGEKTSRLWVAEWARMPVRKMEVDHQKMCDGFLTEQENALAEQQAYFGPPAPRSLRDEKGKR
jgi:hypothetical protein